MNARYIYVQVDIINFMDLDNFLFGNILASQKDNIKCASFENTYLLCLQRMLGLWVFCPRG